MKMSRAAWPALGLCVLAGAAPAVAQNRMTTVRVADSLVRPVFVTAPPGDTSRLFIVEQRGSGGVATRGDIRILDLATNTLLPTPFLSVNGLSTGSEQGLLGLAFDPNYANNGYFYINYTVTGGTTTIARHQVSANPNVANPTGATVLTVAQPFSNHNGGWTAFGPDGYLYIGMGDGGSGCDPGRRAQNNTQLLGKILRIDVSTLPYTIPVTNPFFGHPTFRQEIWAYGVRNPWRNSFDRLTGDLWIGDVGQDTQEEVDFQPAAISPPFTAVNYGWPCREGLVCASTSPSNCVVTDCPAGCASTAFTDPIHVIPQAGTGACSMTGGYVYRGCAMPDIRGRYFFSDYCTSEIRSLVYDGQSVSGVTNHTAELTVTGFPIQGVVSFGEDAAGELYIVAQGPFGQPTQGAIFKIVPRCKANCDGSTGSPALNVNDFLCFMNRYASGDCYANCDGSTSSPTLNVNDFICYQNLYAGSVCQ
jgi:glucose/arabinose dehydrogenase